MLSFNINGQAAKQDDCTFWQKHDICNTVSFQNYEFLNIIIWFLTSLRGQIGLPSTSEIKTNMVCTNYAENVMLCQKVHNRLICVCLAAVL